MFHLLLQLQHHLQINNDKIANTTIQGEKLATDININTTGGIEVHNLVANNDLVVNGNVNLNGGFITLGDAGTDVITTKGTILFNDGATRMLFFKLKNYQDILKPFLVLINRLPEEINGIGILGDTIITNDIEEDLHVVDLLKSI